MLIEHLWSGWASRRGYKTLPKNNHKANKMWQYIAAMTHVHKLDIIQYHEVSQPLNDIQFTLKRV